MIRGEIYLAPFEYADFASAKRRPVCVVSSADLHDHGPDVIVAMVTSNAARRNAPAVGDVVINDWQQAGLLKPSIVRAARLQARSQDLLNGPIGSLSQADLSAIDQSLRLVLHLP